MTDQYPKDCPNAFRPTNVGERLLNEMRERGEHGYIVYGDDEGNVYREFTDGKTEIERGKEWVSHDLKS